MWPSKVSAPSFLQMLRDKHLAFVGDSLGRNQLESLLCMLATASTSQLVCGYSIGGDWICDKFHQWHFPSHNLNCVDLLVTISCTWNWKKTSCRLLEALLGLLGWAVGVWFGANGYYHHIIRALFFTTGLLLRRWFHTRLPTPYVHVVKFHWGRILPCPREDTKGYTLDTIVERTSLKASGQVCGYFFTAPFWRQVDSCFWGGREAAWRDGSGHEQSRGRRSGSCEVKDNNVGGSGYDEIISL